MILLDTALSASMATPDTILFPSWVINAIQAIGVAVSAAFVWFGRYIIITNKRWEQIVKDNTMAMQEVAHTQERVADMIANKMEKTDAFMREFRDEVRRKT